MSISITKTAVRYLYAGIELPFMPDMSATEVRDLNSQQYPELLTAEIEIGDIINGVQEIAFKRVVGTKA